MVWFVWFGLICSESVVLVYCVESLVVCMKLVVCLFVFLMYL